ncbi:MAG TPA: DUF6569 family protein, partial [Vicinamibacterales bacterium]|nr:DUF6569 family protein [Vicinamibacterales bacterium]
MMLENVRLAPDITWRSLAMVPLVGDDAPAADYVPLDEALAGGRVTITEVSDAGRVPELCVVNDGDRAVLIVDGEELVGAKQNRIVNLSILVPARSRLVIPVSCVEAGRWAWRSKRFEAAPHAHYTSGRALKALHVTEALATTGSRIADQLSVWENVSAMSSRLGVASPT